MLWVSCGVGAALVARRPKVAATLLLVAAISQSLALGSGCLDPGCDYGWWHDKTKAIGALDAAAALIAFGSGFVLGRVFAAPRSRLPWTVLATIFAILALLELGATALMMALRDVAGFSLTAIANALMLGITLGAVAGYSIGRASIHPTR